MVKEWEGFLRIVKIDKGKKKAKLSKRQNSNLCIGV
jgi:hypothetical protein